VNIGKQDEQEYEATPPTQAPTPAPEPATPAQEPVPAGAE